MDSQTIHRLLQFNSNFLGTFARDNLPYRIRNNTGLIVNTDPKDKPGEHWVAIFKDKSGYCEYFDPFGLPPLFAEFIQFLNENSSIGIKWSQIQLQCVECITCGYYCVEYIKFRCNNFSLMDLYHSFTINPYINDIIVKNRIQNPII
jgi:hypothetical protein